MSNRVNIKYDIFKETFMEVLHKYAPMKEIIIRSDNAPFMNKSLSTAFMHRTKFKNIYNLFPTEENNLKNKKQKNLVNLVKKTNEENLL